MKMTDYKKLIKEELKASKLDNIITELQCWLDNSSVNVTDIYFHERTPCKLTFEYLQEGVKHKIFLVPHNLKAKNLEYIGSFHGNSRYSVYKEKSEQSF